MYQPQKYLGAYVDVWCKRWSQEILKSRKNGEKNQNREVKLSPMQMMEWSAWTQEADNNENRLGIAVLNPKENKFIYIIQMIMEKYYGLYKEMCWLCGGK